MNAVVKSKLAMNREGRLTFKYLRLIDKWVEID